MSIAIKNIDRLKPSEKIQLVDDILSSMADAPISDSVSKELHRRDREMDRNGGVSWHSVKKKMVSK